ncbi:NHLP leader peptide domain [Pannonibacter phragmitetus]|uniref:NHLP leader peptide domain n=1 Tax=Pannonibacter phragmitetus TaxID=121719 RepID=A0A378ZWM1_9HYPH|nr:hypothetical protein [Pannonibacter phragmitetus]SUB00931.1 NHLP leader peptide domain [Pannonibacter phragmitetus]
MARFPLPASKIPALGRILAEAAADPDKREALCRNPAAVLAAAGLPASLTALFDFRIITETPGSRHVVLPFRYNAEKLALADASYLQDIEASLGQDRPAARH